jgi:tetratricopeptide (TPR) repeat protein
MTWVVLIAAAALAGVAVRGVLRPFGARLPATLEGLADPLDDERVGLLRALKDLDQEHASGGLSDETYRLLRTETETRAVAVLRAIEARDGAGELAVGLKELRVSPPPAPVGGNGKARKTEAIGRAARTPRALVPVVVGLVLMGALVPVLGRAVTGRTGGQPITGTQPSALGTGSRADPLSFFRQRVEQHPQDLAARLDLAQAYLGSGEVEAAITQYEAALRIDHHNPTALANLGFIVFQAGRTDEGLKFVEQALTADPLYPEGLYFKGVILLRGLHRPEEAANAFKSYLQAAPFGSPERRTEVQALLREAERSAPG